MKNKRSQLAAFSLIEVLVSVSLFSVIVLSTTEIFQMVVNSQRSALATQNVQESLKYFLEVTGKEIRMAQKNDGGCPGIAAGEIYGVSSNAYGDTLTFKNYYQQCVTYSLEGDRDTQRFVIARDGLSDFISPAKVKIDRLAFVISGGPITTQPAITLNLKAHALNLGQFQSEMDLQTTITSRYYKN